MFKLELLVELVIMNFGIQAQNGLYLLLKVIRLLEALLLNSSKQMVQ
jgi:hypothetical protein